MTSSKTIRDAKLGFLVVTNSPFRENAGPDELETRFFKKLEGAVDAVHAPAALQTLWNSYCPDQPRSLPSLDT